MQIEQTTVDALVAAPAEALSVEIKRWVDPTSNLGIEKIAKAALALRNRNGGYILIGFDNVSLQPDTQNTPSNIRELFHLDTIQGLVSRYTSELFEIGVAFGNRDGTDFPVIVIPAGVRTPVAAKRDLVDAGRTLIRHGAVYFRTLSSNGTPSTAEARPEDWREIIEICFDNREADIGRFVRRHLAGADFRSLLTAMYEATTPSHPCASPTGRLTSYFTTTSSADTEDNSLRARARALLNEGDEFYQRALTERKLNEDAAALTQRGSWTVALAIQPARQEAMPDRKFLSVIGNSNPKYTGWPVWFDSSSSADSNNRPKVRDGAWEALIISIIAGWSDHLDFARWHPKGEFYLRRVLQDDAVNKIEPLRYLDPILALLRTAEAIAVGLAFAKALGWPPETTKLGFAFRWTKLSNRSLETWANQLVIAPDGKAHDDTVVAYTEIPLETPVSAIAPYVGQVIRELLVVFDGSDIPQNSVEDWVKRLIERTL